MMTTALAIQPADATPLRIVEPLPADKHPVACYMAGLSPGSRRPILHGLNVIARVLSGSRHDARSMPWATVRYQHVAAVRAWLAERYKPNTANLFLTALRGVLKAAWRLGYVTAEDYHKAVDVGRIKGDDSLDDSRAGRALEYREAKALFDVCARDATATGRRDAALLAVLWGAGLRRAELTALTLADVADAGETLRLTVLGKGNKVRSCYLSNGAVEALQAWLAVRGPEAGPLFLATRQGGAIERHGLSTQAIYGRLRMLAKRAGVDAFSPHDLRRTFVGDLLDSGVDLVTVQALAGHSSPTTTARYDRRAGETKRLASLKRRTPYRAPVGSSET